MAITDLKCTHDELTLFVAVARLAPGTKRSVRAWLHEHGIDHTKIVLGAAIQRNATTASLAWREHTADGSVHRRWRFAPDDRTGSWPARFPTSITQTSTDAPDPADDAHPAPSEVCSRPSAKANA